MDKPVTRKPVVDKAHKYACIGVHGARQNNLKNLSLDIPLH